jgi:hypothetical protein
MSDQTAPLDDELRALTGWVGYGGPRVVTAEAIRRFADSLTPARTESGGAASAGDVAPPTFFCPDPVAEVASMGFVRPSAPERSIDGGSTWEPGVATGPGDILTSVGSVRDVTSRVLPDGRRVVVTRCEVRSWNQRGELAGVAGGTIVNYEVRGEA